MSSINPRSLANIQISPEQRKKNHQKASVTRREKLAKEYDELHEREVALGLTTSSSNAASMLLGVKPRKIQHMRRYVKNKQNS